MTFTHQPTKEVLDHGIAGQEQSDDDS